MFYSYSNSCPILVGLNFSPDIKFKLAKKDNMIEMEELDDSDAEIIIEETHNLKLNITFFPSISTGFIRRLKKKEESVEATQTSLIL